MPQDPDGIRMDPSPSSDEDDDSRPILVPEKLTERSPSTTRPEENGIVDQVVNSPTPRPPLPAFVPRGRGGEGLPEYKDQVAPYPKPSDGTSNSKRKTQASGGNDIGARNHFADLVRQHGRQGNLNGENVGPSFKDQARPMDANGDVRPNERGRKDLPSFKDQTRPGQRPKVTNNETDDIPDPVERPSETDDGPSLIRAYIPDDETRDVFEAHAMTEGVFLKRRLVLLIVLVLVVAGAVVGGVCGATDQCRPSPEVVVATNNPTVSPTTAAPTTMAPTTAQPSTTPSSMPSLSDNTAMIFNFIDSIRLGPLPLNLGTLSDDIVTPEEQAVLWLAQDDPLGLSSSDESRLTQRYALAVLFYSTNGDSWFQRTGWLEGMDECLWLGVFCNAGNVVGLGTDAIGAPTRSLLEGNNVAGSIPPDIGLLTNLQYLDLSSNGGLTGSIPVSFANLGSLNLLKVNDCGMRGSIPQFMGDLTNLVTFDIQRNNFTGRLAPTIGNWERLLSFDIQENFFSGSLPSSIGDWASLSVSFFPW